MIGSIELAQRFGITEQHLRRVGKGLGCRPTRIGHTLIWSADDALAIEVHLALVLAKGGRARPRTGRRKGGVRDADSEGL